MGQEENKPVQDDQAWFDALHGKADSGQGARLRRVLREVELADAAEQDTSHDWQRLQFALRREEAKPETKKRSSYRFYAMAASLLILVGTVSLLVPMSNVPKQSPPMSATVMRGTPEQVILSATPEQEANQLESELVRLGVNVTRRGTAEKIELHIPLSYPVRDEVRAALEARIIPVPDQGDLTVLFIQTTRAMH